MTPDWLEQAADIGAHLYGEAIHWDNYCTWMGSSSIKFQDSLVNGLNTLGGDLYGGTAGMALFFAKLAEFTGDAIFRDTALAALEHALHMEATTYRCGYFSGTAGIAITAIRLGRLFDLPQLAQRGLEALGRTRRALAKTAEFDVISGRAGIVLALCQFQSEIQGEDGISEWIFEMATELVEMQVRTDRGSSWIRRGVEEEYGLTGFSHGVAGIISAIAAAATLLGNRRWFEAVEQGLRYEQSWFDVEKGNWADLRNLRQGPARYMSSWCYGAPGIAISRTYLNRILPENTLESQSRIALETTLRSLGHWNNHSLCHGLLGNLEIILTVGEAVGAKDVVDKANYHLMTALEATLGQGRPFISGTADLEYTPELMLGLAGVGYFFLRMHSPTLAPSLLTFNLEAA